MSSQVNTYIMYGLLLKYIELTDVQRDFINEYIDNPFDSKTNLKDNMTVLYDGCNGRYMAIGHVEVKTENNGFFQEPITFNKYLYPPDFNVTSIFQMIDALQLDYEREELHLRWFIVSHYR